MSLPAPSTGPRWKRRYLSALIAKPWMLLARRSHALRAYLDAHGYITPHFTWSSYACTDGTPVPGDLRPNAIRLHWRLEILRHRLGDVPMTVDGPFRTKARNIAVGGASDSRHVHADAADFFATQVDGWIAHGKGNGGPNSRGDILRLASRTFYNGGLGNENSGTLHVDARGFKVRFVTWVASHA